MSAPTSKPPGSAGDYPVVRTIRADIRIRRKQRPEDATVIKMQDLARDWRKEAVRLEGAAPDSADHRTAVCLVNALALLPRLSLRCLTSTLDEERDFAVRCADLEILRAEHALEARKIDRHYIFDDQHWWESPTLKPLVEANNRLWIQIMNLTIEMAKTPVRNRRHLDVKRRLIGRIWLGAAGERYDQMRAGVAADEAWLDEYRPKAVRIRQRPIG